MRAMSSWKSAPAPAVMKPPCLPPTCSACTAATLKTAAGRSMSFPPARSALAVTKKLSSMVKGRGAYSRLKYESGVHRVQRVPVTESSGRIHTSTATVAVLAEVDEVEVNIPESDINIDVSVPPALAGRTCRRMPPPCASPTSPPASWSPARTSVRSSRTKCAP